MSGRVVLQTTEVWILLVSPIILFYCNNIGSRISRDIRSYALKSHTASRSANLVPPSKLGFLDLVLRPIYPTAYLTPPAGCFTGTSQLQVQINLAFSSLVLNIWANVYILLPIIPTTNPRTIPPCVVHGFSFMQFSDYQVHFWYRVRITPLSVKFIVTLFRFCLLPLLHWLISRWAIETCNAWPC